MFNGDLTLLMQDKCIMCNKNFCVFGGRDPINLMAERSDGTKVDVGIIISHGCKEIDEYDDQEWIDIEIEGSSWIVISKNAMVEGLLQGIDGYTIIVESIMLLHSSDTPDFLRDGKGTMFVEKVAATDNQEEAEKIKKQMEVDYGTDIASSMKKFGRFSVN